VFVFVAVLFRRLRASECRKRPFCSSLMPGRGSTTRIVEEPAGFHLLATGQGTKGRFRMVRMALSGLPNENEQTFGEKRYTPAIFPLPTIGPRGLTLLNLRKSRGRYKRRPRGGVIQWGRARGGPGIWPVVLKMSRSRGGRRRPRHRERGNPCLRRGDRTKGCPPGILNMCVYRGAEAVGHPVALARALLRRRTRWKFVS